MFCRIYITEVFCVHQSDVPSFFAHGVTEPRLLCLYTLALCPLACQCPFLSGATMLLNLSSQADMNHFYFPEREPGMSSLFLKTYLPLQLFFSLLSISEDWRTNAVQHFFFLSSISCSPCFMVFLSLFLMFKYIQTVFFKKILKT